MSTIGDPARQAGEDLGRLVKASRDEGVVRMCEQVLAMDRERLASCVVAAVVVLDEHRIFDPPQPAGERS